MAKLKDDSDAVANNLSQDPHRVRDGAEKVLEVAIGREVRSFRRQQGITVADLANLTGLSIGMLSKIENGNTSPSLSSKANSQASTGGCHGGENVMTIKLEGLSKTYNPKMIMRLNQPLQQKDKAVRLMTPLMLNRK